MRTYVPHLGEVDVDMLELHAQQQAASQRNQLFTLFEDRVDCYVNGEAELCWMPGLDHATGEPCSRKRPPAAAASGGSIVIGEVSSGAVGGGSAVVVAGADKAWEGETSEPGKARAARALVMRSVLQDGRVRCFASRQHALLGFLGRSVSADTGRELAATLPAGEAALTDALVAVVAGRADRGAVARGLEELAPLLHHSSLARRLRGGGSGFIKNAARNGTWADELDRGFVHGGGKNDDGHHHHHHQRNNNSAAVDAVMADLAIRAAQMRELLRLAAERETRRRDPALAIHHNKQGFGSSSNKPTAARPFTATELTGSLEAAGIEVTRAVAALQTLG